MKVAHVFAFLAAFLLISRSEAQINTFLNDCIQDPSLINLPGFRAAIAAAVRVVRATGCNVNVCLALDDSMAIGRRDFDLQVTFFQIVSAIISEDERAYISVTQYGFRRRPPIPDIRPDPKDFLLDLKHTKWLRSRRTFLGRGVAFCSQSLQSRTGKPSKIVLSADGRSSYGDLGLGGVLGPAALAANFRSRSPANAVYAVAVGFRDTNLLTNLVGGDQSLVHQVVEWPRVADILLALVKDICSVEMPLRR